MSTRRRIKYAREGLYAAAVDVDGIESEVELLKEGVPIESVAILLGHSSVRITEKHYAAWVKSRQQLLESQVAKTWKKFVVLKGGKKKA